MNKDPRNNASQDQGVPMHEAEHILRFTTADDCEVSLVSAHITGWAIRPPENKGELWHQEPAETRPVELVIHSISMSSTFPVNLSEAQGIAGKLAESLSIWHEYQFTAPRPMIMGMAPKPPSPQTGIVTPNRGIPSFRRQ